VVGKSLSGRVAGVLRAVRGFFESMRILGRLRPKAVIGVGGYASFPMMLAAVVRRIPTLVQDQNAVPGLTNRIVGRLGRSDRHHLRGDAPLFLAAGAS